MTPGDHDAVAAAPAAVQTGKGAPSSTLGWAIVGLGHSAEDLVGPAIHADSNSRIVATVSRDLGRAQGLADRFGAELASTDLGDALAHPGVQVVAVTSAQSSHFAQVISAARTGRHVYCDKPMAVTVEQAALMVEACRDAGVTLGMNFQGRHNPLFKSVRTIIDSGEIGELLSIQIDASPGDEPFVGWFADHKRVGMGAVYNIAIHLYDLVRYISRDEVATVSAMFDVDASSALERLPLVLMRLEQGALVYVNGNQRTPFPLNDLVVHGTKGRIDGRGVTRVTQAESVLNVTTDAGTRSEWHHSKGAYADSVAAFSQSVIAGHVPDASGWDGLSSMEIARAIQVSAIDARHVSVAHALRDDDH